MRGGAVGAVAMLAVLLVSPVVQAGATENASRIVGTCTAQDHVDTCRDWAREEIPGWAGNQSGRTVGWVHETERNVTTWGRGWLQDAVAWGRSTANDTGDYADELENWTWATWGSAHGYVTGPLRPWAEEQLDLWITWATNLDPDLPTPWRCYEGEICTGSISLLDPPVEGPPLPVGDEPPPPQLDTPGTPETLDDPDPPDLVLPEIGAPPAPDEPPAPDPPDAAGERPSALSTAARRAIPDGGHVEDRRGPSALQRSADFEAQDALGIGAPIDRLGPIPGSLVPALVASILGAVVAIRLFRRVTREDALDHDLRSTILERVRATPGVTPTALADELGVARQTITYHADLLCDLGILAADKDGKYTRYYVRGEHDRRLRPLVAALRRDGRGDLLRLLRDEPGLRLAEIARRLDRTPQTVQHHADALADAGLVRETGGEGRQLEIPRDVLETWDRLRT